MVTQNEGSTICLKAIGICKSYGNSSVLHNVDFSLDTGEIHSVLGAKGAGKTTLMQVLSGSISIDEGYIEINHQRPRSHTPTFAMKNGVQSLYGSQHLMQDLTVAENIFMGEYIANRAGFLDYKKLKYKAEEIIDRMKVSINTDMLPINLTEFEKQIVQMARVYANNAKIALVDSIASSFSNDQKQRILEILGEMSQSGIGIVYFTHVVEDALKISGRITVLRDGERVYTVKRKDFDAQTLIQEMVGYKESTTKCLEISQNEPYDPRILELSKAGDNNGNILDYLKGAIDYINDNLSESITPGSVADAVHLSSGYLMMLFKNHMNTSIMEYTYRQRIQKSKELLLESDKNISQIAADVGIPNSQYFSVLFKKYTLMTPKEYRKVNAQSSKTNH